MAAALAPPAAPPLPVPASQHPPPSLLAWQQQAQQQAANGASVYSIRLNPLDASLDLELAADCRSCATLSRDALGYAWAGVRANLGVFARERFYFHVAIGPVRGVNVINAAALPTDFCARVGVSHFQAALEQLGEAPNTYAYCSSGSKACGGASGGEFQPYGPRFGPGDTLTVALDLSTSPGALLFSVNGAAPMAAFHLAQPEHPTQSYFPHILLKNLTAFVDFERVPDASTALGVALQGFRPWQAAPAFTQQCTSTLPSSLPPFSQCELLMMVGLPGCGKTTWAQRHAASHGAKRYVILGPDMLLQRMRILPPSAPVPATDAELAAAPVARQAPQYPGRLEELYALVTDALHSHILPRAAATPRNYILDQTNVTSDARRAKVAAFRAVGFRCVAVCMVVPDAQLFARQHLAFERQAKYVPDEVVAQLRANFTLPSAEEGFDDVIWPEADLKRAWEVVAQQRKDARAWLAHFNPALARERQGQEPILLANGGAAGITAADATAQLPPATAPAPAGAAAAPDSEPVGLPTHGSTAPRPGSAAAGAGSAPAPGPDAPPASAAPLPPLGSGSLKWLKRYQQQQQQDVAGLGGAVGATPAAAQQSGGAAANQPPPGQAQGQADMRAAAATTAALAAVMAAAPAPVAGGGPGGNAGGRVPPWKAIGSSAAARSGAPPS